MKKPQMEVAKTLVEIGLSFDVIELMTQVTPVGLKRLRSGMAHGTHLPTL